MNAVTHGTEVNASAPVSCMALELRNKTWGLALGDGAKRRQVVVLASARVVIETWRRRYNHVRPTQPAGSGHEVNI